jgi:hypothetical protein
VARPVVVVVVVVVVIVIVVIVVVIQPVVAVAVAVAEVSQEAPGQFKVLRLETCPLAVPRTPRHSQSQNPY